MATSFQRSKKLEVSSVSEDNNCATVVLHDEDHTLGNALRYMLMKNPVVKFCGYSMPHPNERKVILQIQTYTKRECERGQTSEKSTKEKVTYQTAMECFEKGLRDLIDVSEHIKSIFKKEYGQFESSNGIDLQ